MNYSVQSAKTIIRKFGAFWGMLFAATSLNANVDSEYTITNLVRTVEMPEGFSVGSGQLEIYKPAAGSRGIGTDRFLFVQEKEGDFLQLMSFKSDNTIADLAAMSVLVYNEYLSRKINNDFALSKFDVDLLDIVIRANYMYIDSVCQRMVHGLYNVDPNRYLERPPETDKIGKFLWCLKELANRDKEWDVDMNGRLGLLDGISEESNNDNLEQIGDGMTNALKGLCFRWSPENAPIAKYAYEFGACLGENCFVQEPKWFMDRIVLNASIDIRKPRCDGLSDSDLFRRGQAKGLIGSLLSRLSSHSGPEEDKKAIDRTIPCSINAETFNMHWKEIQESVLGGPLMFLVRVNEEVSSQVSSSQDREGFTLMRKRVEVWRPRLRTISKKYMYAFYDIPACILTKSAYDQTYKKVHWYHVDRKEVKSIAYSYVRSMADGDMAKLIRSTTATDYILQYHAYLKKCLGNDEYKTFITAQKMSTKDELLRRFRFDDGTKANGDFRRE